MLSDSVNFMRKLPAPVAKAIKYMMVYPRYWACRSKAVQAKKNYGERYRHNTIFIAGLPKSGTTWLEKMISTYPGFEQILIPEVNFYELKNGESHLFDIPSGALERLDKLLVLSKMHCHGSGQNVEALQACSIPYVILYRDLRDVSVSHYFYVRNTPWHGDFPYLKDCNVQEGIAYFIEKRLPEFAHWMRSWRDNRDLESSVMFSYEEMLEDSARVVREVLDLYELDYTADLVGEMIERNSFNRLKGDKPKGRSFFRSGKAGDWMNHYNEDLKKLFKSVDNQILLEFGYEDGDQW